MKLMQMQKMLLFSVFLLAAFLLSSCSSDDSSSANAVPVPTVTGTAAAGLPIVGIVNIKGAEGNTASADIDTDGNYSLNVTGLTAPYILWAQGTVNGESVELYSTGVAEGNINITPITNLITSKVLPNLDDAFTNWSTASETVDEAALQAAETTVQTQLAPILEAYGITAEIDLMSVDFDTDHSGLDAVLDIVEINIDDSNNVTITNTATGTSVTGDEAFSDDEKTAIVQVISETAGMNIFWSALTNLYAGTNTSHTFTEVNTAVGGLVADDFLEAGRNKTEQLTRWASENGLPSGISFTVMIDRPMTATEAGTYAKGYWVNVFYTFQTESGSIQSSMVYNGTNWLWYGNREWVDTWFRFAATKRVSTDGTITYTSDIFHNVDDNDNYAYGQGVRYALIRGPGLSGDIGDGYRYHSMELVYPDTHFQDDTTSIADDATAAAVPENSEYMVWLYATNDYANTTELKEQRTKIPSKPYLPSEVIDSLFPTLTFPSDNDLSTLSIGGNVTLTWTNHAACKVSSAWLSWCADGAFGNNCVDMNKSGLTGSSYTFDTSSNTITPNWARAEIQCTDALGRKRWIDWYLE